MKWYPKLVKEKDSYSLLNFEKYNPTDGDIIIANEISKNTEDKKTTRIYAKFSNYLKFNETLKETAYPNRCYYEVIFGHQRRKQYFDIDWKILSDRDSEEEFFNDFIEKIKEIILDITPTSEKRRIYVYTCHTGKKLSYHIVLNGYYLSSNLESIEFYKRVTSNLNFDDIKLSLESLTGETLNITLSDIIDSSVYSKTQNFRILGCHKWGKGNTKILNKELSYNFFIPEFYKHNEIGESNYFLCSSLITQTGDCDLLRGFEPPVSIKKELSEGCSGEEDVNDVMEIFYKKYSEEDFEVYKVEEDSGNLLIILRRLQASYCNLCERIHENENPYLIVKGINRSIFFDCRRLEEYAEREYLGCLGHKVISLDFIDKNKDFIDKNKDFIDKNKDFIDKNEDFIEDKSLQKKSPDKSQNMKPHQKKLPDKKVKSSASKFRKSPPKTEKTFTYKDFKKLQEKVIQEESYDYKAEKQKTSRRELLNIKLF